jgi:hypothetical protein
MLFDHVERVRFLELAVREGEAEQPRAILKANLQGLEDFVTNGRYTVLVRRMAYKLQRLQGAFLLSACMYYIAAYIQRILMDSERMVIWWMMAPTTARPEDVEFKLARTAYLTLLP